MAHPLHRSQRRRRSRRKTCSDFHAWPERTHERLPVEPQRSSRRWQTHRTRRNWGRRRPGQGLIVLERRLCVCTLSNTDAPAAAQITRPSWSARSRPAASWAAVAGSGAAPAVPRQVEHIVGSQKRASFVKARATTLDPVALSIAGGSIGCDAFLPPQDVDPVLLPSSRKLRNSPEPAFTSARRAARTPAVAKRLRARRPRRRSARP